ncbi:extracellular solute-binding protein [Streptomyces tricolor]|nr:extracellular solute-binding protein [Streptomyces tricolor]
MRRRTTLLTGCTALALALGATACGGSDVAAGGGDKALSGQTVTVAGVWSGSEQKNFQKVLDAFTEKTGAKTQFVSTGDNVSTVVGSKIEGGNAPDVVMVPQVGVLQQFAQKGWLKPLSPTARKTIEADYAPVWKKYGSVDGTLYGLYFKAAHKSTVWYSPDALAQAGVKPPKTYDDLLKAGHTVSDSGLAASPSPDRTAGPSPTGSRTSTLSQAGPEKYDALATHKLKWTDPTVVEALTTLGKLFKDKQLVAGGRNGALNTDFPGSVEKVFGPEPEAGMVYEGDFVAGVAHDQYGRTIGKDADFFPFPAVDGGTAPVVSGGDAAVVLKDGKNAEAGMKLLEYLATPRPRPSGEGRRLPVPEQEARPRLLRRRRHPRHRQVPRRRRRLRPLRHVRPGPGGLRRHQGHRRVEAAPGLPARPVGPEGHRGEARSRRRQGLPGLSGSRP